MLHKYSLDDYSTHLLLTNIALIMQFNIHACYENKRCVFFGTFLWICWYTDTTQI